MALQFEQNPVGVFLVRYQDKDDLLPANQTALTGALRVSAMSRPTGIIFMLSDAIGWVDPAVPKFWLEVTASLPLKAMAIVTKSTGVRIAARGFGIANTVRSVTLLVETFLTEAEALSWVKSQL